MSSISRLPSTRAIGAVLTNTSQTTVYTAVGNNMLEMLLAVLVSNVTGTAATITIEWTDASAAATYSITTATTVPANGNVWIRPIDLPLAASDAIKATAGTGNALHVILMLNEQARGA